MCHPAGSDDRSGPVGRSSNLEIESYDVAASWADGRLELPRLAQDNTWTLAAGAGPRASGRELSEWAARTLVPAGA